VQQLKFLDLSGLAQIPALQHQVPVVVATTVVTQATPVSVVAVAPRTYSVQGAQVSSFRVAKAVMDR
jgi:hypothetical protein